MYDTIETDESNALCPVHIIFPRKFWISKYNNGRGGKSQMQKHTHATRIRTYTNVYSYRTHTCARTTCLPLIPSHCSQSHIIRAYICLSGILWSLLDLLLIFWPTQFILLESVYFFACSLWNMRCRLLMANWIRTLCDYDTNWTWWTFFSFSLLHSLSNLSFFLSLHLSLSFSIFFFLLKVIIVSLYISRRNPDYIGNSAQTHTHTHIHGRITYDSFRPCVSWRKPAVKAKLTNREILCQFRARKCTRMSAKTYVLVNIRICLINIWLPWSRQ